MAAKYLNSSEKQNDPLFPIVAYPYSLCIYYELDAEKDLDKYFHLLREAMTVKAYPILCNNLAHAYQPGFGTPINATEAVRLYRQAAASGLGIAHYNLGLCYHRGFGVVKDAAVAFAYFKQAVELGCKKVLSDLGECYFSGIGTEQDDAQAAQCFLQGAECGLARCQYLLAHCYQNGIGISQNLSLAKHWSKTAFGQGNLHAGLLYATLLLWSDRDRDLNFPQALTVLFKLTENKEDEIFPRVYKGLHITWVCIISVK